MVNKDNNRGFSGLTDLVSDIGDIDASIQASQRSATANTAKTSSSKGGTDNSERGGGWSGIWVAVITGLVILVWIISNEKNNGRQPALPKSEASMYNTRQNNPTPTAKSTVIASLDDLQFTKPGAGNSNVLSVIEIRWCLRENIRLGAMRSIFYSTNGVDNFNRIVSDYNSRCGNYRYYQDHYSRAIDDIASYRNQIISEAIAEARAFEMSTGQLNTSASSHEDEVKQFKPIPSGGAYPENREIIRIAVSKYASGGNRAVSECMSRKIEIYNRRYYKRNPNSIGKDISATIDAATKGTVRTCNNELNAVFNGPSFDCNKASNSTEYMICRTPLLSSLDVSFSNAVAAAKAMAIGDEKTRIVNQLRGWIKERNACGDSLACLKSSYVKGLEFIENF
ncbi:hypothetical protein EV681_0047 [Advenella incenata]|uniref:Uncharacterized protein n=1 Tax=Advenella incenata TaxID=267800 RepID=A0A4Q7VPC4_9BURK|nr:hypothetical protein [Advenella incenata]RZT98271.1 hypothetical protein EV681_0047 [Advenella incenata]